MCQFENDFLAEKYNPSGVTQWSKTYFYRDHLEKESCYDYPVKILTDNSNVYIAGYSDDSYSNKNYFSLVKYSQSPALTLSLTACIQGFYDSATNLMISDTVRVFLRNSSAPYNIVDSAKGKLSSSGAGSFAFSNAVNGVNYYLVIMHRNSLETWSMTTHAFVSNSLTLNMTASALMAYGNNLVQVDAAPVRYADYSGDVNQDGLVDLTDIVNVYNAASAFVTGYKVSDINGDDLTDLTDILITYNNSSSFVSKATP